jgi:hypothetical protein
MNFNHLPLEFEESGSDLENVIELEITIFETFSEMLPAPEDLTEHFILQEDYLQKEIERQEQESLSRMHQSKVP